MPEAEDVLLEAAERVTHLVRSAWERHRGDPEDDGTAATRAAQRRLAAWQSAWLGRSWPVVPFRARPAPGHIARRVRRIPPWTAQTQAAAFTDGQRIWLPHEWLEAGGAAGERNRPLVATLGLARRLHRASIVGPDSESTLLRDLRWILEGAFCDATLAQAWPGLAPALRSLRREAISNRPDPACLRPVEHKLETWLRSLLEAPSACADRRFVGGLDPDSSPADVAEFAASLTRRFGGDGADYRGFAPVAHWGAPHRLASEASSGAAHREAARGSPRRSTRLTRPLTRHQPGDTDRPGPFVLPFADPHLTVEDPGGRVRPPDRGHDEDLDALAEEMSRLDGLSVVHEDASVRETVEDGGSSRAARPEAVELDADHGVAWSYPEWDATTASYREPGCRVREIAAPCDDGGWAEATVHEKHALLARLRRELEGLRPRRQRLWRQPDGDDLDLAGWVDDWADYRAERPPSGRVYSAERPRRRDVAVTLLLDTSGSTESWISGRQRVIDVVKVAALAFGEALSALGDRYALLAFSGQGAADVRVRVLKRFEESPSRRVQRRIGSLEPDAFTRMGGALRHATSGLARERARARLLLVLSDGKPQDEDGYEDHYGVEDVRQAVAEAGLQGIRVFGITIDREGASYLPRMFGPHGYTVIWNAEALPDRLPAVYRKLTAGA